VSQAHQAASAQVQDVLGVRLPVVKYSHDEVWVDDAANVPQAAAGRATRRRPLRSARITRTGANHSAPAHGAGQQPIVGPPHLLPRRCARLLTCPRAKLMNTESLPGGGLRMPGPPTAMRPSVTRHSIMAPRAPEKVMEAGEAEAAPLEAAAACTGWAYGFCNAVRCAFGLGLRAAAAAAPIRFGGKGGGAGAGGGSGGCKPAGSTIGCATSSCCCCCCMRCCCCGVKASPLT
jgi:hypothetical protein